MKIFADCGCRWSWQQHLVVAEEYKTAELIKEVLEEKCDSVIEVAVYSECDWFSPICVYFDIIVVYHGHRIEFRHFTDKYQYKKACITCGTCMGLEFDTTNLFNQLDEHLKEASQLTYAKKICGVTNDKKH